MKTVRKYTNITFLLLSVATIVPAYANPTINEQEQVKQEETTAEPQTTETMWYKRPEVRKKISSALKRISLIAIFTPVGIIFFDPMTLPLPKNIAKYTSITFLKHVSILLLLGAADKITPISNEQEQINQQNIVESQNIETVWYKKPEIHEKISTLKDMATMTAILTALEVTFGLWANVSTYGPYGHRETIN